MNSLYGNYRTRKFSEIYPTVNDFLNDYTNLGIATTITTTNATNLFYLLYARFGNSSIVNSDENQFKFKLFGTIWQYGPTWEKKLSIQASLRGLTEDDLIKGATQINNHSYNPSSAPSTASTDELETINDQNTTKYKKGKMDAYAMLISLLENDVTEEFLGKFKKLFLRIVEPQLPLWYESEEEGGENNA